MKIEIYGEQKEPEKTVRLRLFKESDGGITLAAVDDSGYRFVGGTILSIDERGVEFHPFVDPSFGFELDDLKCVKVINP